MIFIGFDPDLHYPSYGVVQVFSDRTFKILDMGCLDIPAKLKGYDAVSAICAQLPDECLEIAEGIAMLSPQEVHIYCEAMIVRPKQREAVNGLLKLQVTSGAFAAGMSSVLDTDLTKSYFVAPHEWKGDVPKDIHQKRILRWYGIERRQLGLPEKYAKHVVDALGIALWAAQKHLGKDLTPATPVL